jgi:putative aminopeptidase FrvX
MSSDSKELLEIFASTDGVSGDEEEVAELFKIAIEPFVDRVETTPLGSVVATRDGTSGKSIMIAAHMDEVGIMVRYITNDGYIYFVPIGGLDANVLLGQEVRFKDGIVGVIGATPPHLAAPGTVHKTENLWVDIGAKDKKMVEEAGIEIGSYAVINSEPRSIGEYLMAKALDDRAGLVAMIEAMEGIE